MDNERECLACRGTGVISFGVQGGLPTGYHVCACCKGTGKIKVRKVVDNK